ncbi:hypothetical protein MRB53_017620 [Persea americana]|uniref:Uncharacterized protein n=1 Tax=Persea americana TaxID=3435 RepID=A0ACC2M6G9_PERAE|nr:hypothetical protein MRB53_017620 [Persea americana]
MAATMNGSVRRWLRRRSGQQQNPGDGCKPLLGTLVDMKILISLFKQRPEISTAETRGSHPFLSYYGFQ